MVKISTLNFFFLGKTNFNFHSKYSTLKSYFLQSFKYIIVSSEKLAKQFFKHRTVNEVNTQCGSYETLHLELNIYGSYYSIALITTQPKLYHSN